MGNYYVLKLGLVLHITGIVTMAGIFLASFIAYQQFWKLLVTEKEKALIVFKVISRFQVIQIIGGALILTGGITMMLALHGVLMSAFWFKIKMGMLLLLILNAVFVARPAGLKLKQLLAPEQADEFAVSLKVNPVKQRVTLFYSLQFLFFLIIFILSSFQFN